MSRNTIESYRAPSDVVWPLSSPLMISNSHATHMTMDMIMGWVIRLGGGIEPVRGFMYDYCTSRGSFPASDARGSDIDYGAWFAEQVEERANIDHRSEELVWWDYYDSRIRILDRESFALAINEAIALFQHNIGFLIRTRVSSAGREELCSSSFVPKTRLCGGHWVIGEDR